VVREFVDETKRQIQQKLGYQFIPESDQYFIWIEKGQPQHSVWLKCSEDLSINLIFTLEQILFSAIKVTQNRVLRIVQNVKQTIDYNKTAAEQIPKSLFSNITLENHTVPMDES